ncbi:hypothetical protein [Acidihalobacter yilgarnensis]|uniref:hypothetical protein n=1 Tax=Acidihalobacter yilgarnensis TaxID=2819280 RepID=UPI0012EA58EE|nr:hypothetical protein [Acidihalobacter yilgarnensis]
MAHRQLKAIHCTVWKDRRIVFRYKDGRWDIFESIRPWDIRDALKTSLERIEEAVPGSMEKASSLDDKNWQSNKRRTRRYIAETPDLLYIESPHLQAQSEAVAGYHVLTNIPWRDVPHILRLACQAAEIDYGTLSNISF